MSLPPIGAPIMVTTTKDEEIGKFIGIYSPEEDQFVLRPLPGKQYVQQFPMYRRQPPGWEYYIPEEDDEFEIDPDQIRVDVWGVDRLVFPGPRHDPDSFTWELLEDEKIPDYKTPEAIKAMVRKNPYSLNSIDDHDGLTAEVLMDLMNENGLWLSHVQEFYKTREACLAAVRQNPQAIVFVSKGILMQNPIFYEIVVDEYPAFINKIPFNMVTREMLIKALAKNPNIIYLESMQDKIKLKLPNYEGLPDVSPPLVRNISWTQTNQGNQGTCGRHAFSRVIVKNFFELILPFQTHRDQETDCNIFLDTAKLDQPGLIEHLTPQKCSRNGYLKILLFLHCYFLYQKHCPCPTGGLESLQASHIYPYLYTSIEIPHITHDQQDDLSDALLTLKKTQKRFHISLVTFHFRGKDLTFENIEKITDRGLYVKLGLEDSSRKTAGLHANHAVIIVGAKNGFIRIKNSWNDNVVYTIKFGLPFYVRAYTYDILNNCAFVIPVEHPQNEVFQDLTHLDEYLHKYDDLKSRFNGITATVTNTCPSKNKEPVECDEVNTFSKQEGVFSPDYNPRCRKEAEEKFQRLKELCKPKLLTYGTGKRKTRRKRTRRLKY
jgi:hypothetical protein